MLIDEFYFIFLLQQKPKVFEEPHYQTPSGELVSSSGTNSTDEKALFVTYDTPRSIELQQTTSTSETSTKDSVNINRKVRRKANEI